MTQEGQRLKDFLFSKTLAPAVGPTQALVEWVPEFFAGNKVAKV
jgi:hypothetical protein